MASICTHWAISLDHIYVCPHRFFTYFTLGFMHFFTHSPVSIVYIFLIHLSQALSGCSILNKMALLPLYHKTVWTIQRISLIHIDHSRDTPALIPRFIYRQALPQTWSQVFLVNHGHHCTSAIAHGQAHKPGAWECLYHLPRAPFLTENFQAAPG